MASAYIGTTIMPPIFGSLAARFHFSIFPYFLGVTIVVMVILTEIVNNKTTSPKERINEA
ncbi:MAG: hypothetical protein JXJ04_23410 [Spirochaetales bacterium]|nr:hypothetical protein [Spirochaetales bacterium]